MLNMGGLCIYCLAVASVRLVVVFAFSSVSLLLFLQSIRMSFILTQLVVVSCVALTACDCNHIYQGRIAYNQARTWNVLIKVN